jgi:hypothetical protein
MHETKQQNNIPMTELDQCLQLWNIPECFSTYIEPCSKKLLSSWKECEGNLDQNTNSFINIFKTFCGCGKNEELSIFKNSKITEPLFILNKFELGEFSIKKE